MKPPQPKNEKRRLEVLWQHEILDTAPEGNFDDLAELAAEICDAPIALITFVDEHRQWFKSRLGVNLSETSRDVSFCAHAILGSDLLIVPDATKDERFADNPLVTGEPKIRFYAGSPLIDSENLALGTICVIDKKPRELTPAQQQALRLLSRHVMQLLEARRQIAAARESETRQLVKGKYRKIFDNALVGIFRTSPDGKYLEANPAIAEMLGYSSPQEVVNTLTDIGHQLYVDPNQRKAFRELLERDGAVHDFRAEYHCKNGSKIWVKTTAQVVRDEGGKILYYEGVLQEITAQVMAENQLRQSEAQYRTLFEGNPHPMWVFDTETLRFLAVNDAAILHYGFSREEFLSMTIRDIRPPEDVANHEAYHRRVTSGELASGLEQKKIWRHRKKDGTLIDVEITWTTIQFRGKKAQLVLANDVTERKRTEFQNAIFVRLGLSLNSANSIEAAARIITDAADKLLGWDACSLDLLSPEDHTIEPILNIDLVDGRRQDVAPAYASAVASPLAAEVIEKGGKLILRAESDRKSMEGLRAFGNSKRRSASLLFVPIRNVAKVIGVLSIQSYTRNAYDNTSLDILQALADHCGGAIERITAEQKLADERNLLRTLLDHLPDYIFVKDLESHHILVNKAHCKLSGLPSPAEAAGRQLDTRVPKEMADRFRADDRQVFRTGEPIFNREEQSLDSAGNIRWLLTTKVPLRDADGQLIGLVGISRDITESKRIEQRNVALSRLGQDLSAATSPKEAARVIGETTRELFGWDAFILNLYSAESDSIFPVLNIDTFDGKRLEVSSAGSSHPPSPMERRVLEKKPELILKKPPLQMLSDASPLGNTARPSASLMLVPIRNRDKVIGVLSIQSYSLNAYTQQDLGALQTIADHCGGALERIRAEEALRSSEVRFHSVWENSVDGMRLTDENGIIVAVNKAFCDLVQMRQEELVGQPITATYAKTADNATLLDRYKKRFCDRTVPKFFERTMTFRSGKTAELQGTNSFVDLGGGSCLLLGLFRDVTEQKRLENLLRQSQKMESIGQLAGGIAHDFNNLLTVIQGHTSLLLAAEKNPAMNDSLQQISLAAERSANLTRQLLTFSRRQIMQRRTLDMKEVVEEMTKMLRRILGEDITLSVENDAHLPAIHADRGMMEQILLNLAVNSRDAMPRGGELLISTRAEKIADTHTHPIPEAYPGDFVCLTVRDTGCGISPENLPHIFEPFFTTKEIGKGTGLGLATVYGIARQHEGWIEVYSEVNKGTVFKIYFPQSHDTSENSRKFPQEQMPRGSETILVVEDEAPLRELVIFLLERQGYRVLEAHSGVAAVKVWEKHKDEIDLLLTDLVMPEGMTGADLSKRLLADDPELKVIFTSGYSADIVGKDFVLRDGINFLQKPYHPDKLTQTVRDCLDRK